MPRRCAHIIASAAAAPAAAPSQMSRKHAAVAAAEDGDVLGTAVASAPVETIAIVDASELADAAEQCRNVARTSLHPLLPLPNEEMYREALQQQHVSSQAGTTISTFEVLHWPTASHTTQHKYTARKSEDIARPAVQLGEPLQIGMARRWTD
jgi:hypothetical protein